VVVRASPLQSAAIGNQLKVQSESSFIDPKPGVQQPDVHESIPFLVRTCVAVSEVVVASPEQSDDVYEWIVIEDAPLARAIKAEKHKAMKTMLCVFN